MEWMFNVHEVAQSLRSAARKIERREVEVRYFTTQKVNVSGRPAQPSPIINLKVSLEPRPKRK